MERGLVARALAANTNADEVPVATLLRLRDASVRQEAALENFLGFAPASVRAAFATHAALGCVQDAARVRDELLAPLSHRIDGSKNRGFAWPASTKKGESLRRRWFESQSCRVDSLQALLDDLDDLVRADAARACVEINQCVGCTMTRPSWLGRAVKNRHRHAVEQASRRWCGGRRDDSARAVKF